MRLAPGFADTLASIVGRQHVRRGRIQRDGRRGATCAVIQAVPDVVVFPANTVEVAEVLSVAYDHGVAVLPGATAPAEPAIMAVSVGGIMLALDRLNEVIEVNDVERFARIQPGVSLGRLTAAAAAKGLRPPFGSEYTGVHDWGQWPILGIEFVLPSGEIVRTDDDDGHRHRLPEPVRPAGPLSVITEVTVALECARSSAEPPEDARSEVGTEVGIAYFGTVADACQAMRAVLSGGTLPARLEFVDEARLAAAAATGLLGIRSDATALLVFGGDAAAPLSLTELRLIGESCARSGALDVVVPASSAWVTSLLTATIGADSPVLTHRGA